MEQMATDIGSRLRQAREQRGLTLRDVASTTKISMSALTAIEHNDFDRLPGGLFRRAYVRAFAAEVGLNGDDLAREYRARFETEAPADPSPRREVDWRNRLRPRQLLPALLITIVGALVGGTLIVKRAAPVPDEAPVGTAMLTAVANLEDRPAEAVASDGTGEVALANAAVADIGAPSLRLEIRATGVCWVSAVADGERLVYRLMQPGERALVEASVAITLRVGDAGAVSYAINGADGRPLGRSGEAVTVRITSDSLDSLYGEPATSDAPTGAATRIGRGPGRSVEANGQRAAAAPMMPPARTRGEVLESGRAS